MGAIHGRGYYDRIGLGEACFSGARGRCRGRDGSAQAASACAGSGVLQSTAALSDWPGGVRDGALLGAGVARAQAAAVMLGLKVRYFPAQSPQEIDRALSEIAAMRPDGLVVESDANLVSNRSKIIDFVARHRLPTVYGNLDYIPDGGVMAYFTSIFETWRRLATYVDRILKGAKPGELPVEQAVKFELVINLRAAKAIS